MYMRILVVGLSGVLQPEHEPIDAAKPLRWTPLLDEMLRPWKDVRIVVTSSRAKTPTVQELRVLLGPLTPRLFGWTFQILPEEDAISASVRAVNRQLEHLVLFSHDLDLSRQSLNYLKCDPMLGLSSEATQKSVLYWLNTSSPGYCD
jgi:hypothetical protein